MISKFAEIFKQLEAKVVRIFLSHSSKDKGFVARLYEALSLEGVETFLDDRDIMVGDDIRQLIEQGISEATHLVYVISSSSLNSKWVQEELSIAKFRALSDGGLRILPVLIEDLILPPGMAHIKYANFVEWVHSERFFRGINELLRAIGIEKTPIQAGDLSFSFSNIRQLLVAQNSTRAMASFMEGFMDGLYSASWGEFDDYSSQSNLRNQLGRQSISNQLHDVAKILPVRGSDIIEALRKDIQVALESAKTLGYPHDSRLPKAGFVDAVHEFKHQLRRIESSLTQLVQDVVMLRGSDALPVAAEGGEPRAAPDG